MQGKLVRIKVVSLPLPQELSCVDIYINSGLEYEKIKW